MSNSRKAEEICRQMEQLRCELDDDVDEIVEQAQIMADWRYYVRTYPWACMAVAAAVGYLVVPKRLQLLSPDPATLLKLAKKHRLVVEAQPEPQAKGGLLGAAMGLATRSLLRELLGVAGEQAKQWVQPPPSQPPPGVWSERR